MAEAWPAGTIFTIGHSTRSVAELIGLLREAGVDLLVDVRSVPRSRTNPQFNTDALPQALAEAGIGYRHPSARRAPPPSQRRAAIAERAVAQRRLPQLRRLRDDRAVPRRDGRIARALTGAPLRDHVRRGGGWRCHRRLVADYLLSEGVPVAHIMGPGKIEPARLTPGAQPRPDGTIVYAGEATGTLL